MVDIEMSQSQQEYVKKSLLSEIEESLLKGHGIRNTVQVSVLLFPLSYDSSISRLVYRIWCNVLMTFFYVFCRVTSLTKRLKLRKEIMPSLFSVYERQ